MARVVEELPNDIEALKAIVAQRDASISEQAAVIEQQKGKIERLAHNLEIYKRMAFGKSSERRPVAKPENPAQGHLFAALLLEAAEDSAEKHGTKGSVEQQSGAKTPKKGGRRKKFPEHLPRWRTTYELEDEDLTCNCGHALHRVSEDVRKELERIEISIVHEIACTKYACRHCERMVTAPGPDRVIEKGILGTGFLANVLTDRFGHHMPYHRLEKKYASEGLDLSRSVLQRSMRKLGELFRPIYEQLRADVIASPVIFTDDTPVTIAQRSDGVGSKQGRCWIYLDREGRHFFDFTDSRQRDGPARILEGYRGFIQADAYPGYDQLFFPEGATEVGCWAHARRKFVEIESSEPELCKEALARIRGLYLIEKKLREDEASDQERASARKDKAKPILDALGAWLELQLASVLPRSAAAGAIKYSLNQWQALNRYVEDGRLEIDNNAAERGLRPFAVGRKNWLFFQNDSGGETAVVLASLYRTALAVGVNPLAYFRDLMLRISTCSDVTKLTPHGWREHFAKEVDERRSALLAAAAAL